MFTFYGAGCILVPVGLATAFLAALAHAWHASGDQRAGALFGLFLAGCGLVCLVIGIVLSIIAWRSKSRSD